MILSALIEAHRDAYCRWVEAQENHSPAEKKLDQVSNALMKHRPHSIDEVREKAAYMNSCEYFQWSSIERGSIIDALTPIASGEPVIDVGIKTAGTSLYDLVTLYDAIRSITTVVEGYISSSRTRSDQSAHNQLSDFAESLDRLADEISNEAERRMPDTEMEFRQRYYLLMEPSMRFSIYGQSPKQFAAEAVRIAKTNIQIEDAL
jgi:hypothetical protein